MPAIPNERVGPKRPSRAPSLLVLILILTAAGALRAWGLDWGLPHPGRFYPYHGDESVLLDAVCRVNPLWLDFTPGFYNYGSLTILLTRLAFDFASPAAGWGTVPRFGEPFETWVGDFARLLLVGRWLTVLFGIGAAAAAYGLGARLFNRRVGLIAALFWAVAPLPVMLGHYLTVDVPAAALTTAALFCGASALRAEGRRSVLKWLAAGGAAAGLAAGAKYNSGVVLIAFAVPIFSAWRNPAAGRLHPALSSAPVLLAALAGFLLSTPGALLEPDRFQAHLLYELSRNREGQGLVFRETPPALLYHLGISLPVALEWPLFILGFAGLGWSLRRRRAEDWLLLLALLALFLPLLPAERKFVRYVTPLVPILAVLAARFLDEGLAGPRRRLWALAGAAAGAAALASTIAHLGVLSAPDARDQAADYLRRNSRPGDVVALGADPWYYTPPVHPTTGCVKVSLPYGGPPAWDRVPEGAVRPDLYTLPERYSVLAPPSLPGPAGALEVDELQRYRPRYVVLTDLEYEDPQRIRRRDPTFRSGILELMGELERGYAVREFRPRPSLFGFTWWSRGTPPHDWRYYMPAVRIYERK
jgi:hypothetical protein